ncbi:tape measure protein [Companilactobacillus keshanensis]|uniref:Tape measure protein n=1 Tax=Companilactobacillus keshanensis TaxID=2486003 RepID=A0ABW4BTC2_9LACO|nr:tape measure protein [Companilactobacillus keshanensis]
MPDIVVNKVINFLGKDQLTPTAQRVKQAMDNIKDKNVKLDATADEQKIVTFNQKLQGLPKDVQTKLNAMAEKSGFDTFDSYMKALPKDKYTKLKANVEQNGFEAYKSDLKSLPKSQQTELKAKLNDTGFRTFKEWYDKVPKEARTQLNAIAHKAAFEDFERVAKNIPDHINTKVTADTSSANTSLERFSSRMDAAKEKTSRFKSIIGGSLIGGAVLSGLQAMSGGLISAAQSGMQVAEAGEQINRVWEGMGLSAGQTKAMVGSMAELRSATGFSAGAINDLQKKIYGFSGSFTTTQNLTRAFSSLAIESGKGEDAANGLASSYAKVEASGKLSTMAYTRMSKAVPALPRELAKALGMTQDQLTKAVSNGDITSQKFEYAMTQVAAHSSDTFDKFGKTGEGAIARIKSGWTSAKGTLMKPLVEEKTTGLSDIADELNSSAFKGLLTDAGNGLAKLSQHVSSIIKYLSQHKGTISDIAEDLGTIVGIFGKAVWSDMKSIMKTIANMFGLTDKNAKNSADPLKTFESILSSIAKHKTAIKAIAGYFVAMKGFKLAKGAFDPLLKIVGIGGKEGGLLTKVVGKGDNAKKVLRFGVTGLNDSKAKIAEFISGTKNNFSSLFKFIGKGFQGGKLSSTSVGNMSTGAKLATAGVTTGVAATAGLDIVGALKAKNPEQKFEGFGKAAGGAIGGGIGFMLGGPAGEAVGALIGRTLGKYGGKAAKEFTDGWNKAGKGAKPPKGIIQKAGYYSRKAGDAVAEWTKGITTWMGKHKKEILLTLANPFLGIGAFLLKDTKTGKSITKWVSGLGKSVKAATKGKKGLGNNLVGAFKGVGDWLLKDKSTKKGFDKWMSGLESSVKNATKGKKGLLANITGTFAGVSKWLKKDKGTKKAMEKWSDELGSVFNGKKGFAKSFSNSLDSMEKSLKKSKFGKSWDNFWKDTQKTTSSWDKNISKWWSGFSKDFGKKWDKSWKDRKTDMHDDWKNMHSAYDDFTTGIGKWWSGFSTSFGKDWNQGWKDRKTDMHDNWKNMHSAYDDFTAGINSWWSGFSSSFKSGWNSMWQSVADFFKKIFDKFKGWAHDAMSGVVGAINGGIGGINTVIKFFGGKAQSIAPIKYASGVGYHPGGPALINDQKGSVFEEAFKNPGEPWRIIPKMRNVMVDLKPGATVVPATETARRFAPSSVPHYANGVGDWVKGELSDMGKWVKDKLEGITSFLKDPLGNLTSVWDKATSKIAQSTKFGNVFAPPAGHYVVKQSINWFKDQMNKLKDQELEAQSAVGGARPAKAYGSMIRAAADYMHQSITDFNVDMIERIIGNESGGNPHAINLTDNNAKAGTPSKGILQYIDPTFNSYAMPGHKDIWNPLDQLIALFNDATWRSDMGMGYNGKYGEWRGSASGPSGPRLMANGGHVFGATNAIIGEAGDEFAINPSKPSAIPLIGDLMGRMADYHPEFRSSSLTSNISADLGQKLDIVINLLGSIEGKNFAPEINIARTNSNLNQQNRRNTDIYAYQRGDRQ